MHPNMVTKTWPVLNILSLCLKVSNQIPLRMSSESSNPEMRCYILTPPCLSFLDLILSIAQASTGLILQCWFQKKTDDLFCVPSSPDAGASMYKLGIKRDFIARHFLIGGDWGAENLPNSHHYVLELQLTGKELDQHGYLVDIVDVEKHLDKIVNYYQEQMLNDKPEFAGLNPSIEHFARILATTLSERIRAKNITELKVMLWESESAWASFHVDRHESNV